MTNTVDKKVKAKKEKDPIGFFYILKKVYPLCFKAKPSYFIMATLIGIFHGISHGFNVLINQKFFDSVYNVFVGKEELSFAFLMLAAYAGGYIARNLLNAVHNFMYSVNWNRISGFMRILINKKSAEIDAEEFENTKRLDDINKAGQGANNSIGFMMTTLTLFCFYIPYFAFMSVYLYSLHPILIFSVLLTFIPTLISQLIRTPIYAKAEDKAAPVRREMEAYRVAIVDNSIIKQTRIIGGFGYFKKLYAEAIETLCTVKWQATLKSNKLELGLKILSLLGYGGVLFLLFWLMLNGKISIGAFAAVYGSVGTLFAIMEEIIVSHIGNITKNFGTIRNFIRFIDIPIPQRSESAINKKGDIKFTGVSFKYPGAEHESIKNITLEIKGGETIAIVGENGAGKTTLVKLMTGLYKASDGTVSIDNVDLSKAGIKTLFENVSGVFQKYQRYKLTLGENISLAADSSSRTIETVLVENGVDSSDEKSFPTGIDTMLAREFDGVELSGGQWQRISIARGFYRECDLIILDEPTAAIDPIEESRIYSRFVEIASGKTAVIVTHRMGSAKIANRIVVMSGGEIVQIGSHIELMQSGGLYSEMYRAQSGWYNEKAEEKN